MSNSLPNRFQKRFNPFMPNSIIQPEIFVGRGDEIYVLENGLFQTQNNNPFHFLIHGERGIGKSSLLSLIKLTATGKIPSIHGDTFNFLTVTVSLEPSYTFFDVARDVDYELRKQVKKSKDIISASAKGFWDFLQNWEALGVKYNKSSDTVHSPQEIFTQLYENTEKSLDKLSGKIDGILFLFDEVDNVSPAANFGSFCKLFSERLSQDGHLNVALGLSGISTAIKKLRDSHESSPRIFTHIELKPLDEDDQKRAVLSCLDRAETVNKLRINIDDSGLNAISALSEGYPHFLQQFGYSAFSADDDQMINRHDVMSGAFQNGGAFVQLGVKYFHEMYFEQIGSDKYRSVLIMLAEARVRDPDDLGGWVTRKEILAEKPELEKTLHNAITALKKRNIISTKDGKKGVYKIGSRSFAVWIRAMALQSPDEE